MQETLLKHYREFSLYTFPGPYLASIQKDLPDDVKQIGVLVRKNILHPTTLADGNVGTNADLRFGDMQQVPWYRQKEDDVLPTVAAMLAELYRRDVRGLIEDRKVENKIVVSCRYVSLLVSSILKAKGIPSRVRAGHADYFWPAGERNISVDHWITEYWSADMNRWVTIDVDGSWSILDSFDPYDIPQGKFDFPARAWLDIRSSKVDAMRFWNAKPERGPLVLLWSLFYDFHCLMNSEIPYVHGPRLAASAQFANASVAELKKLDHLATLMLNPDENFSELQKIWESDKDVRLLGGGLL